MSSDRLTSGPNAPDGPAMSPETGLPGHATQVRAPFSQASPSGQGGFGWIVGALGVVICIGSLVMLGNLILLHVAGKSVRATPEHCTMSTLTHGVVAPPSSIPDCTVQYVVDGHSHSLVLHTGVSGDVVTVYALPARPTDALTQAAYGSLAGSLIPLIFGAVFVFLGFLQVRYTRRHRRSSHK